MTSIVRTLARLLPVLAIALGAASAARAQQLKWNMPTPYAEQHFHTRNAKAFADEIRQATNGRLDITVHSNGSLFKLSEIKRAVQTGQVPIAEVSLPFYGNEYPFFEIDVVLFLARTYPEARKLWEVSRKHVEGRLLSQGIQTLFVAPFPG